MKKVEPCRKQVVAVIKDLPTTVPNDLPALFASKPPQPVEFYSQILVQGEERMLRGMFVCCLALFGACPVILSQADTGQQPAATAMDAEYRRFEKIASFT